MRYRGGNGWNAAYGFFLFFVTTWGWITIGTVLILSGLLFGLQSHKVAYVQGDQGHYHQFWSKEGFILYQQDNTYNYFGIHIPDFSPTLNMADVLSSRYSDFSFVASTDNLIVDATVTSTGQYIANAHPIERIVFYLNNGQGEQVFTNAEYSGNPDGFLVNYWRYAGPMIGLGTLAIVSTLLVINRKKRRSKRAKIEELAALEARPSPFARELTEP